FSVGPLSAALAIEHATRRLLDGTLDLALAGGIESPDAAIVVRALESDLRISESHPASEAGCLVALRPVKGVGEAPTAIVSSPRRSAASAIDEVAEALAGEMPTDVYLPAVGACDPRQTVVASLRSSATTRTAGTVRWLDFAGRGDLGGASFALALAAAA